MIDPTPLIEIENQIRSRRLDKTIHRTANPECPACIARRLHTAEDWKHHPDAGSGVFEGREMRNQPQ